MAREKARRPRAGTMGAFGPRSSSPLPWAPRPSPGLGLEPLGKFPQLLCLQVCFRALLEKAGLILTSFEGSQTRSSGKGQKESQRKAEKASSALKCRKIACKALIRLP